MKKKILLLCFVIIGISSCVPMYTCPANYQVPSNMKSILGKYKNPEIYEVQQKLKKQAAKKSSRSGNRKYSYKKWGLIICLSSFFWNFNCNLKAKCYNKK